MAKKKVTETKKKHQNTQRKNQKKLISKKKTKKTPKEKKTQLPSSSSDSDTENLQTLLQTHTKPYLINLLTTLALTNQELSSKITSEAEKDTSHRKIFVHGLGWDCEKETLLSALEPYGEIEDCNVIKDRGSGKSKGYGFVLFTTRKGASKALKDPNKKIGNRVASCQLSSVGPPPAASTVTPSSATSSAEQDGMGRKIYVSSVPNDADPEKLRAFFAKFGQIEVGPLGFDTQTGKSRGFALFVYKTAESAKMAVQEQFRVFDGHQLRCQMAIENKNKATSLKGAATITTAVQPIQQPTMAAQNMSMISQQYNYPGLNPLYNGLLTNSIIGGQGYVGSGQLGGYGTTGMTSQLGSYGATGAGQLAEYGTTGMDQLGSYGATGTGQLGGYGTTGMGQLGSYGATGTGQLGGYGATVISQLTPYGATGPGQLGLYGSTGMGQLGGQGSNAPSLVNKLGGGLGSSMLGTFGASARTSGGASGSYSGLTNPSFKR